MSDNYIIGISHVLAAHSGDCRFRSDGYRLRRCPHCCLEQRRTAQRSHVGRECHDSDQLVALATHDRSTIVICETFITQRCHSIIHRYLFAQPQARHQMDQAKVRQQAGRHTADTSNLSGRNRTRRQSRPNDSDREHRRNGGRRAGSFARTAADQKGQMREDGRS